jgi:hypothetical protein
MGDTMDLASERLARKQADHAAVAGGRPPRAKEPIQEPTQADFRRHPVSGLTGAIQSQATVKPGQVPTERH